MSYVPSLSVRGCFTRLRLAGCSGRLSMASCYCDYDWLYEGVTGFLRSPLFSVPLMSFIDENCIIFDTEEENKFEFTVIHQRYSELVDSLITEHLQELGVSAELFAEMLERSQEDKLSTFIQKRLLAMDDFQLFKKMMVKRNMDLEGQALRAIESLRQQEVQPEEEPPALPVAEQSEGENIDADDEEEQRMLQEALKLSAQEYEREIERRRQQEEAEKEKEKEKEREREREQGEGLDGGVVNVTPPHPARPLQPSSLVVEEEAAMEAAVAAAASAKEAVGAVTPHIARDAREQRYEREEAAQRIEHHPSPKESTLAAVHLSSSSASSASPLPTVLPPLATGSYRQSSTVLPPLAKEELRHVRRELAAAAAEERLMRQVEASLQVETVEPPSPLALPPGSKFPSHLLDGTAQPPLHDTADHDQPNETRAMKMTSSADPGNSLSERAAFLRAQRDIILSQKSAERNSALATYKAMEQQQQQQSKKTTHANVEQPTSAGQGQENAGKGEKGASQVVDPAQGVLRPQKSSRALQQLQADFRKNG
jgi:hypothetical protein